MIIRDSLNNDELIEAIYAAAKEYSNLQDKDYLIIAKNTKSEFFWFTCHFKPKNFMHLLGIDSKTYNATDFYGKCIEHFEDPEVKITLNDCTPSRKHSRKDVNQKCSCCSEILKIKEAKYLKTGIKDKISQHVDFQYAYGKEATLGFKMEKRDKNGICFPISLLPKTIENFSTKTYKIIFVLSKEFGKIQYDYLEMEIKQNLLCELYEQMPEELKHIIDSALVRCKQNE